MNHVPVMKTEAVAWLSHISAGLIIDGTAGGGGHCEALLQSTPDSIKILALDRDPNALERCRLRLLGHENRITFLHANFGEIQSYASHIKGQKVVGFLLDLGLSSNQLEAHGRGFSFCDDQSLDMRFDPSEATPSAKNLINQLSVDELSTIFHEFGEERFSRRMARKIVSSRHTAPINTAVQLAEIIQKASPKAFRAGIHPATRIFQALRIVVNTELKFINKGLEAAASLLQTGGRLVVISFHSLEDRIVKQFMLSKTGRCTCPSGLPICVCNPVKSLKILTRKPQLPSQQEWMQNTRSRSAKLRCSEKVGIAGPHV